MTTEIIRTNKIQIGLHPTDSDYTTVPSTLKFHNLKSQVTIDPQYNYEDRSDYPSCGNEPLSKLKKNQKLDGFPDLTFEMKGLDTAISDGVSASTADFPLHEIFESCFSSYLNGQGETGAVTPGTGTTLSLDGGASSSMKAGGLLIETLSGQRLFREIGNAVGLNYTLCRALVDKDGAPETAAANANIWGARTFFANNQVPDRKHLYVDAENINWRRTVNGLMGSLTLKFPSGGLGEVTLSGAKYTGWSAPATASPTCTTASSGNNIPSYGIRTMIDSSLKAASDIEIMLNLEIQPRPSDGAQNGVEGYAVTMMKPTIKFKLRMGTVWNEASDAFYQQLNGDDTVDFLSQFGDVAGACVGVRAPALSVQAKRVVQNGMYVLDCEGLCTVATENNSCFGTDPLRIHVL